MMSHLSKYQQVSIREMKDRGFSVSIRHWWFMMNYYGVKRVYK